MLIKLYFLPSIPKKWSRLKSEELKGDKQSETKVSLFFFQKIMYS